MESVGCRVVDAAIGDVAGGVESSADSDPPHAVSASVAISVAVVSFRPLSSDTLGDLDEFMVEFTEEPCPIVSAPQTSGADPAHSHRASERTRGVR